MVKWTDPTGTCDYYRARILQVGESEKDIKEIVSQKRVRVRPIIEDSDDASDGDSSVPPSKVDISQGLRIPLETWRRVQARDKGSLFIKDLLVMIWDPAQLQGRPLQACYKLRMEKQGFPESVVQTLMKRMNHHVGEKIADIDKMAKRVQRE
ncbi:hypothetical protein MTO96_035923 [Rhipicephalus appendiculatus]